MEDRGRKLPRARQAEARSNQRRGSGRIPPGMPRVRRALDQGAERGISASRSCRRLGASLHHHGFLRRGTDRARADEVRRQRHALSRVKAGDVVGRGKDRARRGRDRIRGLCQRHRVGEVSGRGNGGRSGPGCERFARRLDRDLDHDPLDDSWQSGDQLLTPDRIWTLPSHRCAVAELGDAGRFLYPGGQAGARRAAPGAGYGIQTDQRR